MSKIKIEICTGTTCYVLGASSPHDLKKQLPEQLADRVEVIESPCLKACSDRNYGEAPFARVGGRIVGNVSTERIIELLFDELRQEDVR